MGDGVGQKCPRGSDKTVRPKDSLTRITHLPEELRETPIAPTGGTDAAKTSKPRFVKPTIEEIAAYCTQRNNGIDAEEFFDANEAKGWLVGTTKTPMVDWQATVRTWERKRKQDKREISKGRYHSETTKPAPITGWKKLGGAM